MNHTQNTLTGTILVVDDNPTNIQVLFDVLNASAYRVAIAKSGEGALEKISLINPDLILLDVMMPGIDGFETCRRLKAAQETQDIPIIFMTALSDTVDKVQGLSLGAVDYITKPIQHEEVLARIATQLKLRQLTQGLEKVVTERTADLTEALEALKHTQLELVQSEKMSSLGQLVAGIAHEINNPINFISGNLTPARSYSERLFSLVDLFLQGESINSPLVQAKIEDIDLEFLREDLPKLLNSMQVGADRIQAIVQSLRNFSRLDEAAMKPVDLHSGIDSTLMILQNRLKPNKLHPTIEVVKHYGNLPLVNCYAGQLNQVFMNILANAIDAIEQSRGLWDQEHPRSSQSQSVVRDFPPPRIEIFTTCQNNSVTIRITDNGSGVDQGISCKLFDPFFTTKPVGRGTGLGLSISYQIVVEKHKGRLSCQSTPQQGTEFLIEIPLSEIS
jgi:signal transduction histidine kinase